jgi:hypothetical protein
VHDSLDVSFLEPLIAQETGNFLQVENRVQVVRRLFLPKPPSRSLPIAEWRALPANWHNMIDMIGHGLEPNE